MGKKNLFRMRRTGISRGVSQFVFLSPWRHRKTNVDSVKHHVLTCNPHVFIIRAVKTLDKAIQVAGSQAGLARSIGVAQQVVNNWIKRGNVPAEYCPRIERATAGAVRCEDLRPDVDWAVLRCVRRSMKTAKEAA